MPKKNNLDEIKDHALEFKCDDEGLQIEDRLWWLLGRKQIIRTFIKHVAEQCTISRIIDIGCGSGGNFDVLSEFGTVYGVEPSKTLATRATRRGLAEVVLNCKVEELKDLNADLFTMFDVLEHIENDVRFLEQLRGNASQAHLLLVSVPAVPSMWSNHDRILHHYRRYSKKMLRRTLEASGYTILRIDYFMFFLFPLAFVVRMKDKLLEILNRKTEVELGDLPGFLSKLFVATLKTEAFLSGKASFPIGLWLFALAKKSDIKY